jgi:D-sedoheptulose 7-phosphate isomerase
MQNEKFLTTYFSEMKEIIDGMPLQEIDRAIEALFDAWRNERQVFLIGNGGSAATASHTANDLNKATIVEGKRRFRALCLSDNMSWISALTNDLGWSEAYVEQLKHYFRPGDYVVAFSVHGGKPEDPTREQSQNLLKALRYAKDNHGKTIAFTGFDGGAMKEVADVCVVVTGDSTPHTESFHMALEHLIASCLREKIAEYNDE